MTRMWTPRRERIGIEVYAEQTDRKDGFWFFSDYIRRFQLNDKLIGRILIEGLPVTSRIGDQLARISNRDSELGGGIGFVLRCARLMGAPFDEENPPELHNWFSNPPEELWGKLALGVRGSGAKSPLHYWVEVARWTNPNNPRGINGIVRPYPNPLILRQIPLAYYTAQHFWCRRDPEFRKICTRILKMISEDLEWCAATEKEMDAWWDSVWAEHGDGTPSVTKLRHG